MPDKKFSIGIETRATGDGARKTDSDLKRLRQTVDGTQTSVDDLERELRQAEAALGKADVGTRAFRQLQVQVRKTRQDLSSLKVGDLDARGLDRLQKRFTTLRERVLRVMPAVSQTKRELSTPPRTRWIDNLIGKFGSLSSSIPGGGKINAFFAAIGRGATKANAALITLTLTLGVYVGLVKQGLGRVAITEDLEASFTTLLGSTDRAIARIEEMKRIASSTPLSIAGLATTSRLLETLTGGILATEEGIRLVGDAAAVASRPGESLDATIQNVALHVGRLNAALSAGKGEIGESVLRLTELGLISAGTGQRLRDLHKEGDRGVEAWDLLAKSLQRFEGEMERRSRTINGRLSTLRDNWRAFTAEVARPWAGPFKAAIGIAITALEGLQGAVSKVNSVFGIFRRSASTFLGDVSASAEDVAASIAKIEQAAERGTKSASDAVEALTDKYDEATSAVAKLARQQQQLNQLRLQARLAEIDADDNLTDAEKVQRQASARIRAVGNQSGIEIGLAEDQLGIALKRSEDIQKNIQAITARADRAREELEVIRDESPGAERLREVTDTRLEEIKELERARNELEKVVEGYNSGVVGFVAGSARNALDIFDPANLGLDFGQGNFPSTRDLSARLSGLNDEIVAAYDRLQPLLDRLSEGQHPDIRGRRIASLREEIAQAEAATEQFRDTDLAASQKSIEALREEIKFLREKRELTERLATVQETNRVVRASREQINSERDDTIKSIEQQRKALEENRSTRADEISEILEKLAEFASGDESEEKIDQLADAADEGDVSGAADIAEKALKSRTEAISTLGESLKAQLAGFEQISQTIIANQQQIEAIRQNAAQRLQQTREAGLDAPGFTTPDQGPQRPAVPGEAAAATSARPPQPSQPEAASAQAAQRANTAATEEALRDVASAARDGSSRVASAAVALGSDLTATAAEQQASIEALRADLQEVKSQIRSQR